jgi:hypothetical protein
MWRKIVTEADVQGLMNDYGGFHDSCLRDIHINTTAHVDEARSMHFANPLVFTLLFQRQSLANRILEMKFEGVTGFDLNPVGDGEAGVILGATFKKEGDLVTWADEQDWERGDEGVLWISAKSVHWRYRPELVGNVTRLNQ